MMEAGERAMIHGRVDYDETLCPLWERIIVVIQGDIIKYGVILIESNCCGGEAL